MPVAVIASFSLSSRLSSTRTYKSVLSGRSLGAVGRPETFDWPSNQPLGSQPTTRTRRNEQPKV
ncbi:MAG: hypothetical protein ACK56I_26215, partial [bacterium]